MGSTYTEKGRLFVNPYTFVSLDPNGSAKAEPALGTHSGSLECEIYTKTPLIIPDVSAKEADPVVTDHFHYPFLRVGEDYMILGSSLRGMIRSSYEALTNSCFSQARDAKKISGRSRAPFSPGVIRYENGQYRLYRARRLLLDTRGVQNADGKTVTPDELRRQYGNGVIVSFSSSSERGELVGKVYGKGIMPGKKQGYLFVGEPIRGKKYESIFERQGLVQIDSDKIRDAVAGLKNTLSVYRDATANSILRNKQKDDPDRKWYGDYPKNEKDFPVWFNILKTGKLQLSPAQIGRFTYGNTLYDLLGDAYAPCSDRSRVCPACDVFGMIGMESLGSRIQVTDGIFTGDLQSSAEKTLAELASPKPSYLPFYLDSTGNEVPLSFDARNAKIAGRKYYWHFSPRAENSESRNKTNRNATFEVLEGMEDRPLFRFTVFYDRLTDDQLQTLVYALTLGENRSDGVQCLKIGHGKPLGFGSVKVVVRQLTERVLDGGYTVLKREQQEIAATPSGLIPTNTTSYKEYMKVTNLNAVAGKSVRYPYVEKGAGSSVQPRPNDLASHQWFTRNFPLKAKDAKPNRFLPKTSAPDNTLRAYVWENNGGSEGNDRRGGGNRGNYQNGNRNRFGGKPGYGSKNRGK